MPTLPLPWAGSASPARNRYARHKGRPQCPPRMAVSSSEKRARGWSDRRAKKAPQARRQLEKPAFSNCLRSEDLRNPIQKVAIGPEHEFEGVGAQMRGVPRLPQHPSGDSSHLLQGFVRHAVGAGRAVASLHNETE